MKISALKNLAARDEEGYTLTIRQRNGEPYTDHEGNPCTITVVGNESPSYRKAKNDQNARMRARAKVGADLSEAEAEEEAIELLAGACRSWAGWEDDDFTPVPFSHENVKVLLGVQHIFAQVSQGVNRSTAFFDSESES